VPAVLGSLAPADTGIFLGYLWKDLALFVVVLLLAHLVQKPWRIAGAVVVTLAVLATLTIVNQFVLGSEPSAFGGFATVTAASGELTTTPRHAGPLSDSNFWGRSLLLGLPLAYALLHRAAARRRWLPQIGWGLAILPLLGGIYLTQSRGTFLAALVVTVVWLVTAGPEVRRRSLLLVPVLLLVLALPGVGNRLANLDEIFISSRPAYLLDPSLVERAAIQRIAGIIFSDHRLFGIGPGAFPSMIHRYSAESGDQLVGTVSAPHNLYLQVAVESGILGLVGWTVLIVGMIILTAAAVVRLAGTGNDGRHGVPTRALAAAALAAMVGWSLASVFLHLAYYPSLLIAFALIGVLYRDSADLAARRTPAARAASVRAARGLRVGLRVGAATVVAVAAVVAVMLVSLAVPRYSAEARYTLLPTVLDYEAYFLDIRSREPVLPAYAAMLERGHDGADERADAEPARGVITLTAYGSTRDQAESRLATFTEGAPRALQEYAADRVYRLVALAPPETEVEYTYPDDVLALTGLAVAGELVLIAIVVRRLRGRRP
jgi:O-antigen ligase